MNTANNGQAVDDFETVLKTIIVGTTEQSLRETMKPHKLDFGVVYYGGTGARRFYYQQKNNEQIWFNLSGPPANKVILTGKIEQKTDWIRHRGDSITVK